LVYVIGDSSPSQDWTLGIQLPEGIFYFHIGNVGAGVVQHEVHGCYELMIGTFGLLDLGIPRYTRENGVTISGFDTLGRRVR